MTALRNTWAIFQREVGAYFLSPMAWIVIFLFLLINGIMFRAFCHFFADEPRQITRIVESVFGFSLFWVLPLSPILTMRLFAEEKRTGSMELLMTAPVTETQVVLGKFFAAQKFYFLVWLSLLPLFIILEVLGSVDWGPILSTYFGLFFLGMLTNALGVFASALTRNQLVAAILSLSGNLILFFMTLAAALFPEDPALKRFFHYISFTEHFDTEYFRGIIDLRYMFFYLSFAALFLFFTVRVVEARKWR
jgi:ABC-2 type transport system permease protein